MRAMDPMLRVGRLVPDNPRVSIVILVLDDVDMVEECLVSLSRTIDSSWRPEFVVVANGTSLGRLQALQRHEDIVLVRSETNLGFAGGNNLGARWHAPICWSSSTTMPWWSRTGWTSWS